MVKSNTSFFIFLFFPFSGLDRWGLDLESSIFFLKNSCFIQGVVKKGKLSSNFSEIKKKSKIN